MTGVQIYVPSFLQSYTGNRNRQHVSGGTILECLTMLVERFPRLRSRLFDTENKLRRDRNIYLNDSHVHPSELSRPVKEGDKLYIAHVIVGG